MERDELVHRQGLGPVGGLDARGPRAFPAKDCPELFAALLEETLNKRGEGADIGGQRLGPAGEAHHGAGNIRSGPEALGGQGGDEPDLRGDLHHYSFPTLASHVAKINPFADLFVRQQQARGVKFSLAATIIRPGWRFFRAYVFKLGFLDGFPGFYIAWATAFGAFVRYSRLYEAENRREPHA